MEITEKIAFVFNPQAKLESYDENNDELNFTCTLTKIKKPTKLELEAIFGFISIRDKLNIAVNFDNAEDAVRLKKDNIDEFLSNFESKLGFLSKEDDPPILIVKIEKFADDQCISVYDLEQLIKFWSKDGFLSCFKRIQDLKNKASILCVLGLKASIKTNIFSFVKGLESYNVNFTEKIDRDTVLSKRDKVCHHANSASFLLIPDDFDIDGENIFGPLNDLFSKLKLLKSLIFICDFTRIETELISFRLNGYRLLSRELANKDDFDPSSSDEYYDIYKWIYGDGELVDKVGLARNLISLHLRNDDLIEIHQGTLKSITSGYQIYLKENVKQYIEIKNKVSEFIQSSSDRASDIAKNIGNYYRNSIWTLYTFFFSIFLIRAFISKESHLVTTDVIYFYFAFVILTILAMIYALNELEQDKKRLQEGYMSLKNRYKDLLLSDDLDKILDYDKQHIADIKYLEKKKSQYRKLWGGSLGVVSIIIGILWIQGQS